MHPIMVLLELALKTSSVLLITLEGFSAVHNRLAHHYEWFTSLNEIRIHDVVFFSCLIIRPTIT